MQELTPTQKSALELLKALTNGKFYIWGLAGPSQDANRARLMALLKGVSSFPKSKSGMSALQEEFYNLAGIRREDGCAAVLEDRFEDWAKKALEQD